jgi:hypothetical protein
VRDALRSFQRGLRILDRETRDAVVDDLRHRSLAARDDGRAAGHRLDHHQTERLRPVDRQQQGERVAEEVVLLSIADLADELDQRIVEQVLDGGEVFPVGLVDLGRDPERHAEVLRDADRTIDALLGRDPAEESEVLARLLVERVQLVGQAVMDGAAPVREVERRTLRVRDGDDRNVAEPAVEGRQVRNVETSVKRRDVRRWLPARERKVQVVDVEVDDVELGRARAHLVEHGHVPRQLVDALFVEPERARTGRDETRAGLRITTREQRHVVTLPDQLLRQV